jgi:hypothetical protein
MLRMFTTLCATVGTRPRLGGKAGAARLGAEGASEAGLDGPRAPGATGAAATAEEQRVLADWIWR